MEFIDVEYNQDLEPLETLLAGVERPGDFFVSGAIEMPMPRVDVEGVGTLSFPVPKEQIAALVGTAERAPYGKGPKTVVDTSVRKVWHIAPGKVRIGGRSWAGHFEAILSSVRAGLGCEGVAVSAELYKLLIYDRQGFFLPHRDTEKTGGMFGTLVLTLPSAHRGGELRIRHAGREVTVDTGRTETSELSYVAFYADCEHEALPVRQGNRVCLVYNLVQKRGRGRKKRALDAPEYESEVVETAAILDRFLRPPDAPAKVVWLLEHQYSPSGLSFSGLKGAGAARAGVLAKAALPTGSAHLGIVHIGESGAAEPDDAYSYGSRWSRHWVDDYDDDYNDEVDEDDVDDGDQCPPRFDLLDHALLELHFEFPSRLSHGCRAPWPAARKSPRVAGCGNRGKASQTTLRFPTVPTAPAAAGASPPAVRPVKPITYSLMSGRIVQ